MTHVSTTLPADGETIDAADVNSPFNAIISVLNGGIDSTNIASGSLPWSVMAGFINSIPASAMQDSGDIELWRDELNLSAISSGLVWSAVSGLDGAMTAGTYYDYSGKRNVVSAVASRTFLASRDTYVYITLNGTLGYADVANGAPTPTLPGGDWVYRVITNGSAITSVVDMRGLDGAWIPFVPLTVGWSGTPVTTDTAYRMVGKTVWFKYFVSGTSNATIAQIYLPFVSKTATYGFEGATGLIQNNGTFLTTPGRAYIDPTVSPDRLLFNLNSSGGTFTASGAKAMRGLAVYEAA